MKQALSKFFTFFGKLLSEDNGNPSSIRFMTVLLIVVLGLCVAFTIIWAAMTWQPTPVLILVGEIIALIAGALGIKVAQKGKEEGTNDNPK